MMDAFFMAILYAHCYVAHIMYACLYIYLNMTQASSSARMCKAVGTFITRAHTHRIILTFRFISAHFDMRYFDNGTQLI